MSGGVVQLVAVGPQDAWLTGKPEVSFYRSNYKRYTHYANSVERQVIQGTPIANGISTIRFEKKGDLLSYVYLSVRDNNGAHMVNPDWTRIIDKVELLIGGQIVDTQDIEYMPDIEPITGAQNFSQRYLNNNSTTFNNQKNSFLPLKFFFCKDWSVCLPLIGLQFHDVEVRITWSPYLSQSITIGNTTTPVLTAQPQATANLTSDVVFSTSNTANVLISQTTGPLFPGMMVVAASSNLQTNVAVIQSFSNAFTPVSGQGYFSNVVVSFANSAASNISSQFGLGQTANLYAPVASTQVTAVTATATSATLTIGQVVSPLNQGGVQIGQYVAGLPFTGPVYVSNVNSATSITVSYPSQSASVSVPSGLTISFFTGTAVTSTTYSSLQYVAWSNFVYLDQAERDYFAKIPQNDILITQVQRVVLGNNPVQELALAQPVKFLAFPCVNYAQIYANGVGSLKAADYQFKTQVNGVDVGDSRSLIHWADVPQYYNTPYGYVHNNSVANVAIISYCLDTSKLQPTGTLNFSRLDTFRIVVPPTLPNGVLGLYNTNITSAYPTPYLYAVGYNILRIQNGLGSVLYAN